MFFCLLCFIFHYVLPPWDIYTTCNVEQNYTVLAMNLSFHIFDKTLDSLTQYILLNKYLIVKLLLYNLYRIRSCTRIELRVYSLQVAFVYPFNQTIHNSCIYELKIYIKKMNIKRMCLVTPIFLVLDYYFCCCCSLFFFFAATYISLYSQ